MDTSNVGPLDRLRWIYGEPVLGVRIRGTTREYPFDRDVLTVGRHDCDITLDMTKISKHHCSIERRHEGWLLIDNGSTHGVCLMTPLGDEPRSTIELRPGVGFKVGPIPFVTYGASSQRARLGIQKFLGYTDAFQEQVEHLLEVARERRHIVLQQEAGGGALSVALMVHEASPLRKWPVVVVDMVGKKQGHERERLLRGAPSIASAVRFVEEVGTTAKDQLALVKASAQGTLVVRADLLPRGCSPLMDALAAHQVRLVLVTSHDKPVASLLGEKMLSTTEIVRLPTILERSSEMGTIIERLREAARVKLGDMSIGLRERDLSFIRAHDWPENMEELDRYVERALAMLLRGFEQQAAAKMLGIAKSTMSSWANRYGFKAAR